MRGWGAALCALWCVLACAVIGVRVSGGQAFDTDVQNLLPQTALEPVVRAAIQNASGAASSRVAILVRAASPERTQAARADLERALVDSGQFAPAADEGRAIGAWIFANRNALLCEADPKRFDARAAVTRADTLLYSPLAPVSGDLLAADPFLLTLQLSQCLAPQPGAMGDAALVSGELTESAFRVDVQDAVVAAYEAWRSRWPGVEAARAGAVFHAHDGARRARGEIAWIGGLSTLAVLALLLVCFRRPWAVGGALFVTLAGAVGSLGAALIVFPSVHVLVFVFGSALIGITSDYAVHYLATGPQTGWADPAERLRRVARPLAVCALGAALGFASLGLFGVAIFNQVAVFSVAGVLTAWWATMTLLPLFDRRARDPEKLSAWWAKLERPLVALSWGRKHALLAAAAIIAIAVVGAVRFSALDDVRQFQPRAPQLAAEEAKVREALGFAAAPAFLLSYGASPEAARQSEEAVLAGWPVEAARDTIALSRFDPSATRRQLNQTALEQGLFEPYLSARIARLGLAPGPAPVTAGPATELPPRLAALAGEAGGLHYLIALLGARAAAEPVLAHNAQIVDPAARYTGVFALFRNLAAGAAAAALGVCAILVLAVYRSWRALKVLAAPALGAVLGIALPSALGMPTSFFSVAALFVVIGTGLDHSVFLFEASETEDNPRELAVFLAALTTILSMGLLGLSSTYPVASFGAVIATGVAGAYLLSFVPAGGWGGNARGD